MKTWLCTHCKIARYAETRPTCEGCSRGMVLAGRHRERKALIRTGRKVLKGRAA